MTRPSWHILRDGDELTLARRLPLRFDFAVTRQFPRCSRLILASQIRQDLWRAFQRLKGFAPAVQVVAEGAQMRVTAGGQVDGTFPLDHCRDQLADLLDDPDLRQRWIRHARRSHG